MPRWGAFVAERGLWLRRNITHRVVGRFRLRGVRLRAYIRRACLIAGYRWRLFRRRAWLIAGYRWRLFRDGPRPYLFMLWLAPAGWFEIRVLGRSIITEPPISEPPITEPPISEPPISEPPIVSSQEEKSPRYSLFLWPDAMRHAFFWPGVGFFAYFLYKAGYPTAVISLIWMVWIVPLLLFAVVRVPVHRYTWENWPSHLNSWFGGISGRVTYRKPWFLRIWWGLIDCIPNPFFDRRAAMCWRPSGSPQESFLRAALTEFFCSDGHPDNWCDRGFCRWIVYWCAPVWAGYSLLLLLMPLSGKPLWGSSLQAIDLVIPAFLWAGFSAGYFWHHTCVFPRLASFRREDLLRLPLHLQGKVSLASGLNTTLPDIRVRTVLSVVQLALGGIYLVLLKWLYLNP